MRYFERASRCLTTLLLICAVCCITSCSTTGVLNTLEPHAHISIVRDLRYQAGSRGTLDLYRPKSDGNQTPIVVFIYGGSWDSGDKSNYAFVGEALASAGFLTLIPDYRVYPEVRWPAFLQDNAQAVRWAHDHAAQYGADPRALFVLGHSAGGYDAVMLALDPRWLKAVQMDPARDLRGVAALAGPYDFLPLKSKELQQVFGPLEGRLATQPINHVTGVNPPLLLATDAADRTVEPANTTRLAARVRAAGGPVEERYYHGLNHGLLLGVFAAPLRFLSPVLHDVVQFFNAHARPGGATPGDVARIERRHP
jgi:acetyl esterase/lipase